MAEDFDSKLKRIKIPTTVYLEPYQAEALRTLSKLTGVPQQVYLRRGIDVILRDNLDLLPPELASGII